MKEIIIIYLIGVFISYFVGRKIIRKIFNDENVCYDWFIVFLIFLLFIGFCIGLIVFPIGYLINYITNKNYKFPDVPKWL